MVPRGHFQCWLYWDRLRQCRGAVFEVRILSSGRHWSQRSAAHAVGDRWSLREAVGDRTHFTDEGIQVREVKESILREPSWLAAATTRIPILWKIGFGTLMTKDASISEAPAQGRGRRQAPTYAGVRAQHPGQRPARPEGQRAGECHCAGKTHGKAPDTHEGRNCRNNVVQHWTKPESGFHFGSKILLQA